MNNVITIGSHTSIRPQSVGINIHLLSRETTDGMWAYSMTNAESKVFWVHTRVARQYVTVTLEYRRLY